MRVLIVDTYYPAFMEELYASRPELEDAPYAAQLETLMGAHFGTSDYYSRNLRALGHEAVDVVANCEPLQRRWALEHGVPIRERRWRLRRAAGLRWPARVRTTEWLWTVLAAQLRDFRPDVLHIHDMNGVPRRFLREMRPYVGLITGQIASAVAPASDFAEYDLVLSSFPHFVERFRREGLASEYFQLGFEPRVLDALTPGPAHDLVFIGGLSARHASRIEFLEALARRCPLDWWGYGEDLLAADSPLRAAYRGPAWGIEMYRQLRSARVALNMHVDTAGDFANNMRLYEATGVGSLLLTDAKRNLGEIFVPGRDVVSYASLDECAELAAHYLSREDARAAIAAAGQARTFSSHTYLHRMEELARLLTPRLRSSVGGARG
jgi:spore maturation protein CgeB